MSGARFRLLLALGLTGMATIAGAQTKKAATKFAVPGSPDSVSPASKDVRTASHGRRSSARDAAVATFPGFRLLPDGRSRIYVELTKAVSVDERRADGMLIYVIHDARVPVKNNRNSLITTHFATPVGRARLLAARGDVELIIDLRKPASASQKIVAGENGGARLEVDFPAGDYPPMPGLYDPPAAKGGRSPNDDGAEEGEPAPVQGAAVPASSNESARPTAPAVAPASTPGNGKAPADSRNP